MAEWTQELQPAYAADGELERAAALVRSVATATSNGNALSLLLDYRFEIRKAAFAAASKAAEQDAVKARALEEFVAANNAMDVAPDTETYGIACDAYNIVLEKIIALCPEVAT